MADSTYVGGCFRTFITAIAPVDPYKLVKLESDGTVAVATQATDEIRVGITNAPANGDSPVSVQLLNGGGTAIAEVSTTVTQNDALYGAADGKLATTASGDIVGYALANAVDGDEIEILLA